ncbi:MAG TPA: DHA2 family efflux MFS transporter permease subunit [Myxococcota bacterium]|nr:DHA2 family efflux MFS transporter permease subunit [Myxococcota bacterium]
MSASAESLRLPAQAPAQDAEFRLGLSGWLMLIGVMLALVLEILDSSIVNVALPSMMGNLGATVDEISWVVTSYIIANVIVIPMTSWLAGRFGRRRYFVGSILLFTAASFLCGFSRTLPELVLFRVIQGIGGGALMSTSQSIMMETFPPQRQGSGQALFGMGATLGPSLGPTLGGWITNQWSWPWIFYVNVPLGIIAAMLCWSHLREPKFVRKTDGVDWTGIALLVVGVGAVQTLLERGNKLDWFESDFIRTLAVAGSVSLALFVWHELRTPHPVVDLRVLRHRALTVGCVYGAVMGVGLYGSVFLFPLFTQEVLQWSSWQSGLAIAPSSLATALVMPFAGRIVWRTGPAPLFAVGIAIFVPTLYAMSHWTLQSGTEDLFWPQIARGVALGMMFVPLSLATLRGLPPEDMLQGAGLYNLFRQTGGSMGIAVLATLVDHRTTLHHAYLAESVSPFNVATQQRLQALAGGLAQRGLDPASALEAARHALDGIISQQSAVLAFRDCYLTILLLFLCLAPLVPLLRRPNSMAAPSQDAPAVH